jgi:IS5 family transposase
VGPERLEELVSGLVLELVEGGLIDGEDLAMDATFFKAWSRRDPDDSSVGLSDPEARVGRDGKTFDLGYKAHVAVDSDSDMPLAIVVASANENEKRHVEELMDKASRVIPDIDNVVGDPQYSSQRVRETIAGHEAKPVIPYTSNQKAGEDGLRVDKKFRVSGPEKEKRLYEVGRASVERINSRLDYVGLEHFKLRGLRKALFHVLMCVLTLLLVAVAALRLGRPKRARSIASFYE